MLSDVWWSRGALLTLTLLPTSEGDKWFSSCNRGPQYALDRKMSEPKSQSGCTEEGKKKHLPLLRMEPSSLSNLVCGWLL